MNFDNSKKPIVYFGRLVESKGIEITIKAAHHLLKKHPNNTVPLWIIGGNLSEITSLRYSNHLKDAILELEHANLLFWWGHLPHDILPYILRKCGVFCFTSIYEPGGRTILEAMASKLPVLASPQGFAEELIINGMNGYIVDSIEPTDWADKINELLINRELSERIGNAAFETIKAKYSMSDFYKKHWAIYKAFIQE